MGTISPPGAKWSARTLARARTHLVDDPISRGKLVEQASVRSGSSTARSSAAAQADGPGQDQLAPQESDPRGRHASFYDRQAQVAQGRNRTAGAAATAASNRAQVSRRWKPARVEPAVDVLVALEHNDPHLSMRPGPAAATGRRWHPPRYASEEPGRARALERQHYQSQGWTAATLSARGRATGAKPLRAPARAGTRRSATCTASQGAPVRGHSLAGAGRPFLRSVRGGSVPRRSACAAPPGGKAVARATRGKRADDLAQQPSRHVLV